MAAGETCERDFDSARPERAGLFGRELHARILGAARQVEQLEPSVGCVRIAQKARLQDLRVKRLVGGAGHAPEQASAEFADVGKLIQALEAYDDRNAAAQRQACDGAILSTP